MSAHFGSNSQTTGEHWTAVLKPTYARWIQSMVPEILTEWP
jgi:hypothetical protein